MLDGVPRNFQDNLAILSNFMENFQWQNTISRPNFEFWRFVFWLFSKQRFCFKVKGQN